MVARGGQLEQQNAGERPWFQAGSHGIFLGDPHEAKMLASSNPPGLDGELIRFVDVAVPVRDAHQQTSLNDFDTGFCSLAHLKRMPLDQLKIDKSFVQDVVMDPNEASIVRTVIALGLGLGLAVIAEGVETDEQAAFLLAHGCHHFQGYLFSRPVTLVEFEAHVPRTPPTV